MKKLTMMLAIAAIAMQPGTASAVDLHTDPVNVSGGYFVMTGGGPMVLHGIISVENAADSNDKFQLTRAGMFFFRAGASYIDNRRTGAYTHFRTSQSSDRDTNAISINPNGDLEAHNNLTVGNGLEGTSGTGTMSASVIEIRGSGNDLAETFKVHNPVEAVTSGMVVSIDPSNPGDMMLATQAYDRKVAGVISGAGGLHAGIHLGDTFSEADGFRKVALTGRVWVKVDSTGGAIQPGDMLTTSIVPGHAMKVADYAKAQGAIIGKAMTPVNTSGMVLVLVSLQ